MGIIFNNKRMKARRMELRNRMPKAEILLWKELKGSALGVKFRRQHSMGPYVADFYCSSAKLVIEIDGDSHFTEKAIDYDQDRQEQIESIGIRVLRFTNDQIYGSLESVVEQIRKETAPPLAPPRGGGE